MPFSVIQSWILFLTLHNIFSVIPKCFLWHLVTSFNEIPKHNFQIKRKIFFWHLRISFTNIFFNIQVERKRWKILPFFDILLNIFKSIWWIFLHFSNLKKIFALTFFSENFIRKAIKEWTTNWIRMGVFVTTLISL